MPQIKHIAISSQDPDKTAQFYKEVFGMEEAGKIDNPNTSGYYLTDGHINLAILCFKNDVVAGAERGKDYSGLHHIGFQVEDIDEIAAKLEAVNSQPRDDINRALGVGMGGTPRHANVEVKYTAPDGVTVDVSQLGWVGTSGLASTR